MKLMNSVTNNWIVLSIIALIIVSARFLLIRFSVDKFKVNKLLFVSITTIITGIFVLLYSLCCNPSNLYNELVSLDSGVYKYIIGVSLLLAIQIYFVFYSITTAPNPGYPLLIINLNMIVVTILACSFIKTKIDLNKIIGMIVCFIGMFIFFYK